MDLHRAAAMPGCFAPEPDHRPKLAACGRDRYGRIAGVAGDVQGGP